MNLKPTDNVLEQIEIAANYYKNTAFSFQFVAEQDNDDVYYRMVLANQRAESGVITTKRPRFPLFISDYSSSVDEAFTLHTINILFFIIHKHNYEIAMKNLDNNELLTLIAKNAQYESNSYNSTYHPPLFNAALRKFQPYEFSDVPFSDEPYTRLSYDSELNIYTRQRSHKFQVNTNELYAIQLKDLTINEDD